MRATDFLRANADKNKMVPLQTAIEAAYMAQDDALNSLRNQAAANMMPAILNAYHKEGNEQFQGLLNRLMQSDRKTISEVMAEIAVGYADTLITRLKED